MRKKELLEFGQAWVALIALAGVTLTVAIAATYGLNLLGVGGDTQTSQAYTSTLYGLSVAILGLMLWTYPKPKGWAGAYMRAFAALTLAWVALTAVRLLLDNAFGYEDGWHQGVATAVWLVICCVWLYAVYRVINTLHQHLIRFTASARPQKSHRAQNF